MPANLVTINGKMEFIIPDSKMEKLLDFLFVTAVGGKSLPVDEEDASAPSQKTAVRELNMSDSDT